MLPGPHSYLSPKLEVRAWHGQFGVFAVEPVKTGELISVWSGIVVNAEQLSQLPDETQRHTIQVEEGLFFASILPDEPADYINHSCNPNAGLVGQLTLVAMRNIKPGEEIGFDYATADSTPYDEFDCECGANNCRGRVTGNDWRKPELWRRYKGHFMPYLQRRIDRLQAQEKSARKATQTAMGMGVQQA
ncbi:MAG: SET domain-containing protein [Anaerolineae bacterium]|nr:SET domain-containing protein [Anaerolineae bacterium]